MAAHSLDKGGNLCPGEQGGGAAAQVEGVKGGKLAAVKPGLLFQGLKKSGDLIGSSDGIEIAIRAFGPAEGDVDVKTRGRGQGPGIRGEGVRARAHGRSPLNLLLVFIIRVIDRVKSPLASIPDLIFTTKSCAPSYVDGVCVFDPTHHIDTPAPIARKNHIAFRPHPRSALKNTSSRFSRLKLFSSKASWNWIFPLIWSFHWQTFVSPMHKTRTIGNVCWRATSINDIELTSNKITCCKYSWLRARNRTTLPNYNITDMKFRAMS